MLARCSTTVRLRLSPNPYLIPSRPMSASAYLLPFDPSAAQKPVQGVVAQTLWSSTPSGDKPPKVGTTRTFFNQPNGTTTTISSLGDKFQDKKGNERRELVRKAVGSGIKELRAYDGLKEVSVDASADPHAAGAYALFESFIGSRVHICACSCRCQSCVVQIFVKDDTSGPLQP